MNDVTEGAVVQREAPVPVAVTPMAMIQHAMQSGASMEQLEKLLDLQERWERNEARKAFVAAMAAFKADPPSILKSKQVNIPGGAKFAHATLADVCDGVCAALGKHGLSHKWETSQTDSGITVACIITHNMGHSERTVLTAAPDDSGKKNSIQQLASTVTYLERYTLMAATGLAARDMDDDGNGAGKRKDEGMPEKQVVDFETAIDGATDAEALAALWKTIVAECRKLGDMVSYNSLKAKVEAKGETLRAAA
jgi:hypothetical protein